jgi:hypothetical protein
VVGRYLGHQERELLCHVDPHQALVGHVGLAMRVGEDDIDDVALLASSRCPTGRYAKLTAQGDDILGSTMAHGKAENTYGQNHTTPDTDLRKPGSSPDQTPKASWEDAAEEQ